MPEDGGAVFEGVVVHRRVRPRPHGLRYRVFALALDLDAVPELSKRLALFSHNRFNLLSFHDRDHGPGDGSPLRPWIDARLREAGIDPAGGSVTLLCYPRILGYVFNPLTVWFCRDAGGRLQALLYEVRNTFGQRHSYLIRVEEDAAVIRQTCAKGFYVSPFIEMDATYHFRVMPDGPDQPRLAVVIREADAEGPFLDASFTARRRALSDGALLSACLRHPLMAVKVIAGIHWEALKLWRKGFAFHRRPAPPEQPVTIVS